MGGGARRYDLGTGRPFNKVTVATDLVGPGVVVVSNDGKRAAVSRAGTLTVVDADTGKQVLAAKPPEGTIIVGTPGASLSGDGKVVAYGVKGREGKGEVVVWNVDKNEMVAQIETDQLAPVYPTLSRDGKFLATHGPPAPALKIAPQSPAEPMPAAVPMPKQDPDTLRTAQVWEAETGKELFKARVTGMGGIVVAAAFSADGSKVAFSAGDGPVDVWDVPTGKRIHTLLGRKAQGVKVAFSPDGKTIASVGPDYRIQRWRSDGKPLEVTEAPPGLLIAQLSGLTFADNERAIAWVTAAQFCVAWEAPTGRLVSPLMDHAAAIRSIAYADGVKDLYTSGVDGRVFRWDFPTGQLNEAIHLHPAHIPGQPLLRPIVTISADATRASDARIPTEVFDMATGQDLFVVPPPSAPPAVSGITTSPDAMKLITVSRQADTKRAGSCVVWDLTTQQRVVEFELPISRGGVTPLAHLNQEGTRVVVLTVSRNAVGQDVLVITGFDAKTGKKIASVEDPSPTGTHHMAAVGENSAVLVNAAGRLWTADYVAGRITEIDKLPAQGEAAVYSHVVFSQDGKRFATGINGEVFETYGVRVYDWETRKALHTFIGHAGPVTTMRFHQDGKSLASGAQDTSVLLWDLTKIPNGKEPEKEKEKEKEKDKDKDK
jgi:WD40 repeat protein